MTTPTDLLLIAETIGSRPQPSFPDLLGAAGAYTAGSGKTARVLLPGVDMAAPAAELATDGRDIFTLENPGLDLPNPVLAAALIVRILPQIRPRHICLPHTMRGIQIAAALAVHTSKPVVTGVENISRPGGRLHFHRALFNGKLTAALAVPDTGTIFTYGGGRAPADGRTDDKTGRVIALSEPATSAGTDCGAQPLGLSREPEEEAALEEADAIVAAGRGIGQAEKLDLLRAVAGILKHSALGGSRTACDAGWLPYSRQVGETGRRVAPELYLACGISGARQHLAGIKNAKTVIAVNTDPQAAIFNRADFGIVEDLTLFLPVLLEKYKERIE